MRSDYIVFVLDSCGMIFKSAVYFLISFLVYICMPNFFFAINGILGPNLHGDVICCHCKFPGRTTLLIIFRESGVQPGSKVTGRKGIKRCPPHVQHNVSFRFTQMGRQMET